jgi:hypothetical protein
MACPLWKNKRPPTEAALFADLIKIDHATIAELGHILMMAPTSKKLTSEEFASLLKVANTSAMLEPPAIIPAEHSARLVELGYMADLDGRLRNDFHWQVHNSGGGKPKQARTQSGQLRWPYSVSGDLVLPSSPASQPAT